MDPLQGSRVKIRGHMIAHRTPSAPGLTGVFEFMNVLTIFVSRKSKVKVTVGNDPKTV